MSDNKISISFIKITKAPNFLLLSTIFTKLARYFFFIFLFFIFLTSCEKPQTELKINHRKRIYDKSQHNRQDDLTDYNSLNLTAFLRVCPSVVLAIISKYSI